MSCQDQLPRRRLLNNSVFYENHVAKQAQDGVQLFNMLPWELMSVNVDRQPLLHTFVTRYICPVPISTQRLRWIQGGYSRVCARRVGCASGDVMRCAPVLGQEHFFLLA